MSSGVKEGVVKPAARFVIPNCQFMARSGVPQENLVRPVRKLVVPGKSTGGIAGKDHALDGVRMLGETGKFLAGLKIPDTGYVIRATR